MTSASGVAPDGDLSTYEKGSFTGPGGETNDVYRKGSGPAVIVITEMPGITPKVLGFADRVVALGCTAVVPDLYGTAGRDPGESSTAGATAYMLKSIVGGCVSKSFSTWALDVTSPIADWLRALARREHERCGGPGVGAVGMCFSGGFSLAMATDPSVVAPVMSQPSLPLAAFGKKRHGAIDVSSQDLAVVADRCAAEGMKVLGLRFEGDAFVPAARFEYLRERLGDGFVAVEMSQEDGNPAFLESPTAREHHSVLTNSLVDEPGSPTHDALTQVLNLFRDKLLVD